MTRIKQTSIGNLSEAEIGIEFDGDNGNDDSLIITVEGNQFDLTEFKTTEDGFQLKIKGQWEIIDFLKAMSEFNLLSADTI